VNANTLEDNPLWNFEVNPLASWLRVSGTAPEIKHGPISSPSAGSSLPCTHEGIMANRLRAGFVWFNMPPLVF